MVAKKIAVIGAGNMGAALLRGILASGWGEKAKLVASHPKEQKASMLAMELDIKILEDNAAAAKDADIIILAVKPQILGAVLEEIKPVVRKGQLLISIAAGFPTSRIESIVGRNTPVIRAMPNVAAVVKASATALCAGKHATAQHVSEARTIFESIGLVVELAEYQLDAVTGLSGTGPMYIFQVIEGLSDAGVRVGLSRDVASALTIQTLMGAAKMAETLKVHPAMLKDLVTSPGGTAIAALHSLERNQLRATLMDAVEVATQRSKELGQAHDAKPTTTAR
ncbi:MAG TPA: pyrroline-5-carboxylate reductase [Candidatus Thermoplasmatota archaeon]|nr:pyrroline-5-carboxylate reductase [Candidatus Thermoplasmatota archaeon]